MLQAPGNEDRRVAVWRPLTGRHARHPDGVERQAGCLERSHQVNLRDFRFRLEYRFRRHPFQLAECGLERHPRTHQVHARKIVEKITPPVDQLKIVAVQALQSWPACSIQ